MAGRAALRDLPRAKHEGNLEEHPCQPDENATHPISFTWIYILFNRRHFGGFLNFSNIDV